VWFCTPGPEAGPRAAEPQRKGTQREEGENGVSEVFSYDSVFEDLPVVGASTA
jgi:hypothetical protein